MPLALGTVAGIFIALCGIALLVLLVLSPENEDMHFGQPRKASADLKRIRNNDLARPRR